jgi:hypothetical protein
MSTGGLRHWKDGRDAADVMLGLFEYAKTAAHPEFTLSLKVNFADGSGGEEGFRFVGPEGVLSIGWDGLTLSRRETDREPGHTIDTFPKAVQDAFLEEYRKKYPDAGRELRAAREEEWQRPEGYSDLEHHVANFVAAVRSRSGVPEDPAFGLRAAGPALLCNRSLKEKRPIAWDPQAMRVADAKRA